MRCKRFDKPLFDTSRLERLANREPKSDPAVAIWIVLLATVATLTVLAWAAWTTGG